MLQPNPHEPNHFSNLEINAMLFVVAVCTAVVLIVSLPIALSKL